MGKPGKNGFAGRPGNPGTPGKRGENGNSGSPGRPGRDKDFPSIIFILSISILTHTQMNCPVLILIYRSFFIHLNFVFIDLLK